MSNGSQFRKESDVDTQKEAKIREWKNKVSEGEKVTYNDGSTYEG